MTVAEIIDVVDLDDKVVGSLPRALLDERKAHFRVVHVLLLDPRGNLLLQRPAGRLQKPFDLGSSVAGHVKAGESYETAARREYGEELGLPPPDLLDLGKTWLDEHGRRKFVGVFVARESRTPMVDRAEVDSIECLPVPEVRRLVREGSPRFSETFRRAFRHVDASGYFG